MKYHPIGCTLIGVQKSDGTWLVGSNSDNPWKSRTRLLTAKSGSYRYIGTELFCTGDQNVPWADMITRGLNERGLGFTYAHVEPTDGNWASEQGVNFHDFSIHLLSECATVKEAEDYIRSVKRAFHGNFIVNDANQDIALLEVSTKRVHTIRPSQWEWKPPLICCNYYVSNEMRFYSDLEYALESNAHCRWHNAMLTARKSDCTGMDLLKQILTSHEGRLPEDEDWSRCPCNHGKTVGTVSSEIIDTATSTFYYCLGWPCGCQTPEAGQEYQQLSWGCYKAFKVCDYSQSAILVDCQNNINVALE